DVALWLHGPERGTPEVRVVWRADIDRDELNDAAREQLVADYASTSLAAAPPSSLEAISVPLPAFRAWIAEVENVALADVEGACSALSEQPTEHDEKRRTSRAFLVATKSGARIYREPGDATPESTLVVPASYGGIREGNWDPDSRELVSDLGDQAQLAHRGRPVLRLLPQLIPELPEAITSSLPKVVDADDLGFDPRTAVDDWLEAARTAGPDWWQAVATELLVAKSKLRLIQLGDSHFAAIGPRLSRQRLEAIGGGVDLTSDIVSDDDDAASMIGVEVGLEQHLGDVERWMQHFAANLHLSDAIASDLALAARLHDIGKADPRFQQLLHGGSAVRMAA
ncbi:MAG: hypothetical protein KC492_00615, partial [Myxococcales bacterium]|nr:hypothetical protein [Myxococcales bacterium]